jgi:hypothetical protein
LVSLKQVLRSFWGDAVNGYHSTFDLYVTNTDNAVASNIKVTITPHAGASIEQTWNMQYSSNVYTLTSSVEWGTYAGAGYVSALPATVKLICPSVANTTANTTHVNATVAGNTTHVNTTVAPAPRASSSSTSTTSSSSSSTSSTSEGAEEIMCQAAVSFTLLNSWNGGGLVAMTITNVGTRVIHDIDLHAPGTFSTSWNMEAKSDSIYTLPSWAFPLVPGQTYTAAGYTYNGTQPTGGSISAAYC